MNGDGGGRMAYGSAIAPTDRKPMLASSPDLPSHPSPGPPPDTSTVASAGRPVLRLARHRDQRVRHGSPWVFSNQVDLTAPLKALAPGALVRIETADGKPRGVATFNPNTLICARLHDPDPEAVLDAAWFARKLKAALRLRERFFAKPLYRLVHAEADALPGFVADRYGDTVVVQANTAGAEALTPAFLAALDEVVRPASVVLRNNSAGRALEGLAERTEVVKGSVAGPILIEDRGAKFPVDVLKGQKTGWYLDLAEARGRVGRLAAKARMLDLCCNAGAFSVIAAKAGAASVLGVDGSDLALDLARQAAALNGVAPRCEFVKDDVFAAAEKLLAENRRFDLVVADPPSFVKSKKDIKKGGAAYKKLARLAAGVTARHGFLFIASCSHNMTAELFAAEVASGLGQAGRTGRIVAIGGAGPDHPVHPHLPETAYLKWQLMQID
jgi:23S rRNA (cytosine1962-C5)-methyltransferase